MRVLIKTHRKSKNELGDEKEKQAVNPSMAYFLESWFLSALSPYSRDYGVTLLFHHSTTLLPFLFTSEELSLFSLLLVMPMCSVINDEWIISLTQLVIKVLRQTLCTGCRFMPLFVCFWVFFFWFDQPS